MIVQRTWFGFKNRLFTWFGSQWMERENKIQHVHSASYKHEPALIQQAARYTATQIHGTSCSKHHVHSKQTIYTTNLEIKWQQSL